MSSKIMDLPVEDIVPDQNQPRKTFDKANFKRGNYDVTDK